MPHERTLPKAKSDRLELLRATRANLDPIWGLSLATGLSTLLAQAHADRPDAPVATATDEDGFHHSLWRITDPERMEAIRAAVAGARLVLADGHHRFETATTYRAERRAAGVDDPGADGIMTLVVELAPGQLVRASDPPPARLASAGSTCAPRWPARSGSTRPAPNAPEGVAALEVAMRESGGLGLVDRDGLALLLPDGGARRPAWTRFPEELRDVDSARFDAGVLPAVPGVSLAYRNDAVDGRRAGREGRRRRRGAAATGHRRHHPRRGRGRPAHAGEDHLLRAEAAHRDGVPQPRRLDGAARASRPSGSVGAQLTSQVAPVPMSLPRSPGP